MPPMHYSLFGVLAAAIFAASAIVSRHRFIDLIWWEISLLYPNFSPSAVTCHRHRCRYRRLSHRAPL